MLPPRIAARTMLIALLGLGVIPVSGQDYPNKPIRIVTGTSGAGLDIVTRMLAPGLSVGLGQPVVVDNRNAILAPEGVAQSPGDGYVLLLYGSPVWLAPFLRDNVPFDPVKDFSPITIAVTQPNVIVVNASTGVNSIKELIALAKAQPGKLNYATPSQGSAGHLASELFKSMAGISMVQIPYKGASQALIALIGNEVQMATESAGSVGPHLKSGKVKALAVTSAQPSPLFPGLPTVAASGLQGYEASSIYGVFAPGKTPSRIIDRLNQEFVRALNQPEIKERLLSSAIEVVASTPAQLAAAVKSEMTVLGKLIKDLGIRSE